MGEFVDNDNLRMILISEVFIRLRFDKTNNNKPIMFLNLLSYGVCKCMPVPSQEMKVVVHSLDVFALLILPYFIICL